MNLDRAIQRTQRGFQSDDTEARKNGLTSAVQTFEGRRFFWILIGSANIFNQTFSDNALRTAFQEGRRAIGLELLNYLIEVAPEAYLLMQKENADVSRNRNAKFAELNAAASRDPDDDSADD